MTSDPTGFEPDEPELAPDIQPAGGPGAGGTSVWRSPRLTALLAVLVVVLVAIIIAPMLNLPRIVVILGDPSSPPASASQQPATASPEPTASPSSPAASPSFIRPTPTPEPTFLTYTVQPSDSLGSIANAYRTTARSIAWWNRGTYPSLDPESPDYAPNRILVGWVLVLIPGVVVDDSNPPTLSPGPPTPSPAPDAPTPTPTEEASPAPSASS